MARGAETQAREIRMRIFEIIGEDIEAHDGDRVIGVYVPGMTYTCRDDDSHQWLAQTLDQWIAEGKAKIVEQGEGTGPASIGGQGKVE